jgi:hypothetical protein
MSKLPEGVELFDKYGKLAPLSASVVDSLDDETKAGWQTVRDAYDANAQADADLKAAQDQVVTLAAELRDAEEYVKAHFPAMTHAALVKDWIKSERAAKYL